MSAAKANAIYSLSVVIATDRATNATVRVFTMERDATPPQVWLNAPAGVVTGPITVT